MKKKTLSLLLLLCITLTQLLPQFTVRSEAATKYFNDSDVTWIGAEKDFAKTLKAMFDSNGLRKEIAGDIQADGSLDNIKYGLVDKYGKWAAEPVYESIEPYFILKENVDKPFVETIFVDGYVQAVKNGKMGLLDSKGKEAIPCNYDAVGLPVEGVSRIIKKSGDKYYLGYWSLEKKKEIVKPNKYVVSGTDATAEGTPANYEMATRSAEWDYEDTAADYYQSIGSNRVAVKYDFNGGYALVPSGKVERVDLSSTSTYTNAFNASTYLIYAQIIDKAGKEILSGGPYPYRDNGIYPQYGQYMVYHQVKKEKISQKWGGGTLSFNQYLASGVVGKKGLVIKAQYHGGIRGNAATGWFVADANMRLVPGQNLVITSKDVSNGTKENGARSGVINLSNKAVIPFEGPYEFPPIYMAEHQVFDANGWLYRTDGTKIPKSNKIVTWNGSLIIKNGYFLIHNDKGDFGGAVNIKTGKAYNHQNLTVPLDSPYTKAISDVSSAGTLWVSKLDKNGKRKFGLVNLQGKVLVPYEYDSVAADWDKGIAAVYQNGKMGLIDPKGKVLLPCKYGTYYKDVGDYTILSEADTGLYGVYNRKTKKMVIPCKYEYITDMIEGSFVAQVGPTLQLMVNDKNKEITKTYSSVSTGTKSGLYLNNNWDFIGPEGKIVFPRSAVIAKYNGNKTYTYEDLTVVVKDGKVGYIRASRLARNGKIPKTVSLNLEPNPISTETTYFIIKFPEKRVYKSGQKFNIAGYILHSQDVNGVRKVLDNSKINFVISGSTTRISDGTTLSSKGIKRLVCYYDGKDTGQWFDIKVD